MSCPPAAMPSITTGLRLARAAYTAAVRPAGPEPTITSLRASLIRSFPCSEPSRVRRLAVRLVVVGLRRLLRPERPAERSDEDQHSADDQVGEPHVAGEHDETAEDADQEQRE